MVENSLSVLVQDVTQTLYITLPHLYFQFYTFADSPDYLDVFGFTTQHQLVGGSTLHLISDAFQFSLEVLGCTQFFRNASTVPTPHFFRATLQALYQRHLSSGAGWSLGA